MRLILFAVFILSSFQSYAEDLILSGSDCYVGIDELRCVANPYYPVLGPPCDWSAYATGYWENMDLSSPSSLIFKDSAMNLVARVDIVQTLATFEIQAPHVNFRIKKEMSQDNLGNFEVSAATSYLPSDTSQRGQMYRVSCSPGLSHKVKLIKEREESEMDRLGPPGEWEDSAALSLEFLPLGTILQLKSDLKVIPGTETAAQYLVEDHGAMSLTEFNAIPLQWRFAFVFFNNSNNGYLKTVTYPAGMRLRVKAVEVHPLSGGGRNYTLRLETETHGVSDPITWMNVNGRRSGRFDIKIPQFKRLLAPTFEVIL